jgi:molybdate transport system substrate-binding protein
MSRTSGTIRVFAVAAAAALALTACAATEEAPGPASSSPGVTGEITVFAAASLTDVFTEMGADFEAANPGVTVTFNFAGSSTLAQQINEGAPADVFAAASPSTMATVTDAGNGEGEPVVFVRNQLVIVVAKGNPQGIDGLADLAEPDVTVALCADQVPCGAAAKAAISSAGVTIVPVTLEQDVRAALSKVTLGEVDAALVYRTDAASAADEVDAIEFPESARAINNYPIVALRDAPNPDGAAAFVAYALSDPAVEVFTAAGFQSG